MRMTAKYKTTYQARNNFLKWCQYWMKEGCAIYHTSWGHYYPKFKLVEYNTEEILKKFSTKRHMHINKEYHAIDDQGHHVFFDKKTLFKGDWAIEFCNNADELFE